MRLSVKVFLWCIVLQVLVVGIALIHEQINIHFPLSINKEVEFEFSNPAKLLGTTDYKAIESEKKAKERLTKLKELTKRKALIDSLHKEGSNMAIDTSDQAEKIRLYNYVRPDSVFALDTFFEALQQCENGKSSEIIRIAHYGDSQIEGDRISSSIRRLFHKQFKGGGPAFIPVKDILTTPFYTRTSSENWTRFTMFHDIYSNSRYGYGGLVFRFSSLKANDSTPKTANFSVSSNKFGDYNRASLLWGNAQVPCKVTVTAAGNTKTHQLPVSNEFNILQHDFKKGTPTVTYEFSTTKSPDVYGVLLDDTTGGIQIDNFSLRGHSGQGILKMSPEYLKTQYKATNTQLIIIQYGGNAVPYVNTEQDAKNLEDTYYAIFMHLKKAAPKASMLMIGTGDMAHTIEGTYQSYKQLPATVEAQRKACERAGIAYWDLFQVMGGEGSMVDWVREKPALAVSDYLHFSEKGCNLVAELFYDALMNEYALFKQKKLKEKTKKMNEELQQDIKKLPN